MSSRLVLCAVASALLALGGCKKQNAYVPPPPPEVGVAKPESRAVIPYLEATGTLVAYNQVDLVARVEGFLQEIKYKDGTEVKAGTSLFVIEPLPYQVKVQQAQAALASAQALFLNANIEYNRQYQLGKTDVSSQAHVDQAKATRDSDQANVTSQQTNVALANINLGYTNVTAPFDGVVTEHLVSVGELVGHTGPTKLATLVQLDPIYVSFTVDEQEVQRIRAALAASGKTLADLGHIPVEIGLMTESGYPHHGVLDYAAPSVTGGTGTLVVRGVLDNAKRALLPGYFVRVRVPQSHAPKPSLLVPDAALGTSQAGRYLLVVGKDDVLEQRPVTIGALDGPLRVITSGLQAGDQVVITGLGRVVAGEKVSPQPAAMPAPAPAG